MFLTDRQTEIVAIAKSSGRVLVEELASRFSVTRQTIRKDLNDLCDAQVPVSYTHLTLPTNREV